MFYARTKGQHSLLKMDLCERISPAEQRVFDMLISTVQHRSLPVVLRCAGGWVRDNLLGLGSNDIDIAIEGMSGKEFANQVEAYLEERGLKAEWNVIKSNPDQSKHLETVWMRYNGFELDLVGLRSETYADTRIPLSTTGTAKEDAERRDCTINSLFYNLMTREVEDHTGMGIDDLRTKLIRTPLQARQTLLDDPLRILRAIRFGSRLGFTLDVDLLRAAATREVHDALSKKVSRERIGKEIMKIFEGDRPLVAIKLIERLGLIPCVFGGETDWSPKGLKSLEAAEKLLRDPWRLDGRFSKEERTLALVAALLLPLRSRGTTRVFQIMSQSLKWPKAFAKTVGLVHKECGPLAEALPDIYTRNYDPLRVRMGTSVQRLSGDTYKTAIILAVIWDDLQRDMFGSTTAHKKVCENIEHTIDVLNLASCWERKPLLNGVQIQQELGIDSGTEVGKAIERLRQFHLKYPLATEKDARRFLQSG